MKKLNNKGMTIIEIIVTFVLVVAIILSLYRSIENLKHKKAIISYKQTTTEYRDLLTRAIENDLIYKQLTSAEMKENAQNHKIIIFHFRNNPDKTLKIIQKTGYKIDEDSEVCDKSMTVNNNNFESIIYDNEEYKLPDVGGENIVSSDGKCRRVNALKIDDVSFSTEGNILNIRIGLFHPDFGGKYSIKIIYPMYN